MTTSEREEALRLLHHAISAAMIGEGGQQLAHDALDTLAAALEAAERERDHWKYKADGLAAERDHWRQGLEATERELERVRRWFATEPWKGNPDPDSFGGHPYSANERTIGYGTYRDPRFLPDVLKRSTP